MTKIIFTRHGETEDNIIHKLSTSAPGPLLTQKGREQAEHLYKRLLNTEIDLVYSSPLLRALETSEILIKDRGIQIIEENGFRELSVGELEGRNDEAVFVELDKIWNSWTIDNNLNLEVSKGGESAKQVIERASESLKNLVEDNEGKTILVVAHSGVLQLLICYICENLPFNYGYVNWLRNCETVEVDYSNEKYTCLSWSGDKL